MTGTFVAVVGSSGVGKDSLLDYARDRLDDPALVFVRRAVTRPAGPGEDHDPVDPAAFDPAAYAVAWRAHGLAYGLPARIDDDVRAGRVVVANVSRAVLGELAARYPLRVVRVSVSPEVRAARMRARGREDAAGIAERIERPDPAPGTASDLELLNDGPLPEAGERLVAFLRELAASRPRRASIRT